jgi:hypothetical protein
MHDDEFQDTFPNVTTALRRILAVSLSAVATTYQANLQVKNDLLNYQYSGPLVIRIPCYYEQFWAK